MHILNCNILETSSFDVCTQQEYPVYRIPGIVALQNGTLAVCYECRQNSDWSVIDIGFRTSSDGGKSWTTRRIPASGKGRNAVNNPTLIAEENTLHLLYCENYKRMFHIQSKDNGITWSAPIEMTDIFDSQYWSCVAGGPGHGLAHSTGTLFASVWMAFNQQDMFSHHPSKCGVICSKDHGNTWSLGHVFNDNLKDASEAALGELSDGSVMMNIRNENTEHFRAVANSKDGCTEWTVPEIDRNLPDPICFGGMCNCADGILFVNCNSQQSRENLTLYKSTDDGKTWESLLLDRSGGYADVCYNKITDSAFVFYETMDCRYLKIAEISFY
ncbi:MAG: exo-alpha-sialidase [Ruminococcaceae bacterium]|nr:exo-alpha-sialidase [Oscillospiraceae bacterium]